MRKLKTGETGSMDFILRFCSSQSNRLELWLIAQGVVKLPEVKAWGPKKDKDHDQRHN